MASLFSRDGILGRSRRYSFSSTSSTTTTSSSRFSPSTAAATPIITTTRSFPSLPSPFGELNPNISSTDLRDTAYEIFLAANRTSTGKALTYVSNDGNSPDSSHSGLQRSPTSSSASTMKNALGLKSINSKKSEGCSGTSGSGSNSGGKGGVKPVTIGELMRVQMRISESSDTRIRRALLRISAAQVGKKIESMVIPLELLQQFKCSDFTDQEEYNKWQKRSLKVLESGLLKHPHVTLDKSNTAAQRLQQIIQNALDKPIETGKNNEAMQILRTAVMTLASRSSDGVWDACHWADGIPLNLRFYETLLDACFDVNDETYVLDEVDMVMELLRKTWGILGINQLLHNLCFTWVIFNRFVMTGQIENDLLHGVDNQLAEVAKDSKISKDPTYAKILNSTLTSILGWAEKRLLAYHETFDNLNIDSMRSVVSLGVTAAKILVDDISNEYRRRRKNEVNVARSRIDTYIRSSLRTSFAQRMEKVDSSRRASRNQPNSLPILVILAKDVGELACKENETFSPILKQWHPFAAGVAAATLHTCYGNELRQYVSQITELTPDAVQILRAADKLEKDLVHVAVEDSVECDDGGKAVIREMAPYEAEALMAKLVKDWIKTRIDRLKESVDNNLQQEAWNLQANQEAFAPSAVEILRIIDEILNAFFHLPIQIHPSLLPDLMAGIDRCLHYYVTKAKSGCGSRNTYIPIMPALTRCTTGKKLGMFKKKEKPTNLPKTNSKIVSRNEHAMFEIPNICVRINTFQRIRIELDVLERNVITLLRNSESKDSFPNGLIKKLDLARASCVEGIQQLCETIAYKIVFRDLSFNLYDGLYIGEPSSSRIQPFLHDLQEKLTVVSETIVHVNVRTHIFIDIMTACFEGFLLVLLAGGPSRGFAQEDYKIIEMDFKSIKDMFFANGIQIDVINKGSIRVIDVLVLFQTDTETLINILRQLTAKSGVLLPPTTGEWSPTDSNTLLRVLCYRNDEMASKFLRKTYDLPKKL